MCVSNCMYVCVFVCVCVWNKNRKVRVDVARIAKFVGWVWDRTHEISSLLLAFLSFSYFTFLPVYRLTLLSAHRFLLSSQRSKLRFAHLRSFYLEVIFTSLCSCYNCYWIIWLLVCLLVFECLCVSLFRCVAFVSCLLAFLFCFIKLLQFFNKHARAHTHTHNT